MGCFLHYVSSVDIMAATSSHLEQGYEKIFRWCSNEFRQLSRDVQYEVNPTLSECIQRLRKRPELLRYAHCLGCGGSFRLTIKLLAKRFPFFLKHDKQLFLLPSPQL